MEKDIKTFTAKEMHDRPSCVFREADRDGEVRINHSHYSDRIFVLISRDRREEPRN